MNYDTYDGYIITDSIRIGTNCLVLGVHLQEANCFATWNRTTSGTYHEKHSFDDLLAAQKDLISRASVEIESIEQRQGERKQTKLREERER